jgi:hypothetical protein
LQDDADQVFTALQRMIARHYTVFVSTIRRFCGGDSMSGIVHPVWILASIVRTLYTL